MAKDSLPPPLGLYVRKSVGNIATDHLDLAPLISAPTMTCGGIEFAMIGLSI
jgi:hypothetical protein